MVNIYVICFLICFCFKKGFCFMTVQSTLSIIKPDAVERNIVGSVLSMFEKKELKISAIKKLHLSHRQACLFYDVHKHRPFFDDLVQYMIRSSVVVSVLTGDDAVAQHRLVMGATNPAEAQAGTIRKLYGLDIQQNSVHGSDSLENAQKEIAFFFASSEVFS